MKDTGFRVDLEHFKKAKLNIQAEIDELERQLQLEVSEVTSHMEDAFLDKTFPPQPIRDFAEAIILEADLPLPLNPKSGSFSLAKGIKKKWVTEVTKDCTAEQLVVIWFIDEQCNKLPTELIRATQRRMWEERDGGYVVNLNSSTQLAKVLYDMWGIRSTETTATGEPSFTASIIQNIAIKRMTENDSLSPSEAEERFEEYMECAKLPDDADWFIKYLRKKKLEKILSTYIDGIMELQINGRIHADFLQFGTNAGRYSLKRPNLQNLPAHSALGEVVKRGYIA